MSLSRSEEKVIVFTFAMPVEDSPRYDEAKVHFPISKEDVRLIERVTKMSLEDFLRAALEGDS